ncbi:BRcat and Rcat domain-containing protein [Aspergillus clavatus NRRL 1]|uniref:RBR-type E3 ubiquitin transferase n=1 Tax=Aspergillus clavatus (strain ATCC 1007 / CBS 513.65 / DSM 816 / NCTC 3887 / NRRL 1 / QM 1276 / 107) TaxID=344612 RepID=A1C926_ASPCL|nr:IBR domain protein [Aspergillus clavatus NRRL 1]EAW13350.1 IBR domain protein [Aspergillus clavatus NRRL 1]
MALVAVTDEQLFPPKCCAKEIPQETVVSKLRRKEKALYAYKLQEYATPKAERRYCPALGCGRWIPLDKLNSSSPTQNCPYCNTAICSCCHNAAHGSQECPFDHGLTAFIELAQMEGWQRCYNCGEVVERESGCDHIVCRCGAQFCYNCGKPWITCCCSGSGKGRTRPFQADGNGLTVEEIAELSVMVTAVVHAERELEIERLANERQKHQTGWLNGRF